MSDTITNLLKLVADKGGSISEGDPDFDRYEPALHDAARAGLLESGGGWAVAFDLTAKGREALSA